MLLVALFVASVAYAQQPGIHDPLMGKSIVDQSLQAKLPHTFDIQMQQPVKKAGISDPKAVVWKWDTITTYTVLDTLYRLIQTFDMNGNILTYFIEVVNNNAWVVLWRHTYINDVNGNILSDLFETKDTSNNWINSTRTTCTYNANGQLLTKLTEGWYNNTWNTSSN